MFWKPLGPLFGTLGAPWGNLRALGTAFGGHLELNMPPQRSPMTGCILLGTELGPGICFERPQGPGTCHGGAWNAESPSP